MANRTGVQTDEVPSGIGTPSQEGSQTARGWLHGKIFISLLVERLLAEAEAFSPWGYRLPDKPQQVA